MSLKSENLAYKLTSSAMTLAALFLIPVAVLGWFGRTFLHAFALHHPAFYPSVFIGMSILCLTFAMIMLLESAGVRRAWLARTAGLVELEGVMPSTLLESLRKTIPDPFEFISKPLFQTKFGTRLQEDWKDAELGDKASRYLWLLALFAAGGFALGWRVGGPLLSVALSLIGPLIPRALIRTRADRLRNRFTEQLPQVLDGLASGLAAGLSFQGALEYIQRELAEPSRSIFRRVSTRLALGKPFEAALTHLQDEVDQEAFGLVVEGLILQRHFGGNMVQMLEQTAQLLRERNELEQEVRAITTQGRMSGLIIAGLVPISAGFLLAFNPRYIDVLFDNVIGQALVILAMLLQLVGWAIISRLLRVRF